MFLIYGYQANIPEEGVPLACQIIKTLSEWPNKSRAVIDYIDRYGGSILVKPVYCHQNKLCDLCLEENQFNFHRFIELVSTLGCPYEYRLHLKLIKFIDQHKSNLLEKIPGMPAIAKISTSEDYWML